VKPEVLAVDEPSTNLDRNGREIAYSIMREFKRKGLLLFATNEDHETEMGDVRVELGR
jgi:energy-coupling factor transporter ATP-binding protein EcfA2